MKKIIIGIGALLLLSGVGMLLAVNQWYFGYRVSSTSLTATLNSSSSWISTPATKIEEWWICKKVSSTDSRSLFVPTKTSNEWSIFLGNKPSHITLAECGCRTNSNCSASQICQGYITWTSSACAWIYTVADWYCDGNCAWATDPNCLCGGMSQESCWSTWDSHGCSWVNTTTTYACSSLTTQSQCTSKSTCTWSASVWEVLWTCYNSCTLPRWWTINHGSSVTAYAASSVACWSNCSSIAQTRTCNNGSLWWSYTNQSCSAPCASCTLPRWWTVPHGTRVTAYYASFVPCGGSCQSQTVICNDWSLWLTYYNETCTEETSCGTCFKPGTQILLADGTTKSIEEIQTGEYIRWSENTQNTVIQTFKLWNKWKLYAINDTNYFVTETHPFMTTEWWKSFNPKKTLKENPDMIVSMLKVGDILITKTWIQRIYSIDSILDPGYVYNFKLDKNHTYYANGYLVHNPAIK